MSWTFWTPAAVDWITGQLWKMFLNVGHGCVSWKTNKNYLWMTGVVSNERLQAKLLSIAEPAPLDSQPFMARPASAEVPLLDLQLPEVRWLLQGIFRQSLLMQVMGQNDGLESAELDRLCDHRCVYGSSRVNSLG